MSRRRRPLGDRAPVVGVVAFLSALAVGAAWQWALLGAIAAGPGVALCVGVVPRRRDESRRRGDEGLDYPPGLTPDRVREVLGEAAASVATTRTVAEGVVDAAVRAKVLAWCDGADRLIADLRGRPKDIARARRFLVSCPEAAHAIVAAHARLERQVRGAAGIRPEACEGGAAKVAAGAAASDEARCRELLDRVGPAFDDLDVALREQRDALLRDDAFDLDVELSLLSRTLRFEGHPDNAAARLA